MSINRRRWSNELLNSLMDFQSRENSQLSDSLNEEHTDITSMLNSLEIQKNRVISKEASGESSSSTLVLSNSGNEIEQDSPSVNVLNKSMTEDVSIKSKEDSGHLLNLNERLTDNVNFSSDSGTIKYSSNQNTFESVSSGTSKKEISSNNLLKSVEKTVGNKIKYSSNQDIFKSSNSQTYKKTVSNIDLFNLDDGIVENRIKYYSNQDLYKSVKSQTHKKTASSIDLFNLDYEAVENKLKYCSNLDLYKSANSEKSKKTVSYIDLFNLDDGTIEKKVINRSAEENTDDSNNEKMVLDSHDILKNNKNDQMGHKYFSSPLDFPKTNDTMIDDMDQPDFWDALMALDEALSPFDENKEKPHEISHSHPDVLSRLSQKFKATPTRFTEKLVSILEDSILSIESPTKQHVADTSAVSLNRITGEFRKLCKFIGFIEDESMPSLMNATNFEKTETPECEKIETPKKKCTPPEYNSTPIALKTLFTPKNKILSRVNSPMNRFSPTADKSFEYWEKICDIMCQNTESAKKKAEKVVPKSDGPKLSMDEILTICERQLASLDDSTMDVRISEPCKKTDSEIKLKVEQMPRSKSVSKMYSTGKKSKPSSSSTKKTNDKIKEKLIFHSNVESAKKLEDEKKSNEINLLLDESVGSRNVINDKKSNFNGDEEVSLEDDRKFNNFGSLKKLGDNKDFHEIDLLLNESVGRRNRTKNTVTLFDDDEKSDSFFDEKDRSKNIGQSEKSSCNTKLQEMDLISNKSIECKSNVKNKESFFDDIKEINYFQDYNDGSIIFGSSKKSGDNKSLQKMNLVSEKCEINKKTLFEGSLSEDESFTLKDESTYQEDANEKSYKIPEDRIIHLHNEKSLYKSKKKQKEFEDDFQIITYSPHERSINENAYSPQEKSTDEKMYSPQEKSTDKNMYDPDDPDCSLLIELAKRRQRCLDTAKLMMEIDKEDPMNNDDTTCLETLYKLGIQDKTFNEVEEDTKFLKTLNQCLEYRNYFSNQSKPLVTMLQNYDSPNDLKKRAKSLIKTKKSMGQNRTKFFNRPYSQSNKKIAPKVVPKMTTRVNQKVEKTPRLLSFRDTKATSKIISKSVTKVAPPCKSVSKSQQPTQPSKLMPKPTTNSVSTFKTPRSESKAFLLKQPILKTSSSKSPKVVATALQKGSTPKVTEKILLSPDSDLLPTCQENHKEITPPQLSSKIKLFVTPGKSSNVAMLGRRKPKSYFSDFDKKSPAIQKTYDSVKSPISLYIRGTDNDLIQNVQGRINERLLTPVSNGDHGQSPKLKFRLSSKENLSPSCNENIVLPTVRYQSAKKVCLIDDQNCSPSSITPNSRTKKLLEPVENTLVIRHEGRVINAMASNYLDSETSIRVQKVAEKATSLRKKLM